MVTVKTIFTCSHRIVCEAKKETLIVRCSSTDTGFLLLKELEAEAIKLI